MITRYDQQYEEACEALEKAVAKRNEAQIEVVRRERELSLVKRLQREEVNAQIALAKQPFPNGRYAGKSEGGV